MAKIPFDIKYRPQIESGKYKVETRSGLPARIVCWDRKTKDMEILALVYDKHIDEDNEYIAEVALNGKMFPRGKNHNYDLFVVTPEEELTDFEKKLWEMLKSEGSPIGPIEKFTNADKEVFHSYAAELLAIAKEECKNQIENDYREIILGAYEKGMENVLKDLPRWKKADGKERFNERLIVLAGDNDLLCTNYAEKGEYYISFSDLEKLPKGG